MKLVKLFVTKISSSYPISRGDFDKSLGNQQRDMKLTSENSPLRRRFKFERSFLHSPTTLYFFFIHTHCRDTHHTRSHTPHLLSCDHCTPYAIDRGLFQNRSVVKRKHVDLLTPHRCRTIHPHIVIGDKKSMTIAVLSFCFKLLSSERFGS